MLFAGEGRIGKPILRAHDKATGDIVAEIALPAPQTGLPMSYAIDGEQYIVVAVAGADHPAELVALKLPRNSIQRLSLVNTCCRCGIIGA